MLPDSFGTELADADVEKPRRLALQDIYVDLVHGDDYITKKKTGPWPVRVWEFINSNKKPGEVSSSGLSIPVYSRDTAGMTGVPERG